MSGKPNEPVIAFIRQRESKPITLAAIIKPFAEPEVKPKSTILAELEAEIPGKITKVRSCSDCCMECNPDGTPNTVGKEHQRKLTKTVTNVHGTHSWLECRDCYVFQNITEEEWNQMLADIDGTE